MIEAKEFHDCSYCLRTITFVQPLRREMYFACSYCKASLRSRLVPREGYYAPHFIIEAA